MKKRKQELKSTIWQKEEISIQPEKNEETRIQINEERLRNLQDIYNSDVGTFKGVPEGEEEEQKN